MPRLADPPLVTDKRLFCVPRQRYCGSRVEGVRDMAGVFISYRREDAAASAGRLFDHLAARLGQDQVFMDVDGLEPGMDFHDVLNERVSACDALIAVIGRDWSDARDADGRRRLDEPDDFVRIEVAAGLSRNVRVIPVLVDGARMPTVEELPEDLKLLARRNAAEISHMRFTADVERLADVLERIVSPGAAPAPPQPAAPKPSALGDIAGLASALERFDLMKQIYVGEAIPANKLANARRKCEIGDDVPIYALIDFTVMGNANDAMLITPDGLIQHHSSSDQPQPQHIPFNVLIDGPVQKEGWWQVRSGPARLTVSGGPDRDTLIEILEAIRAALA